MAFGFFSGELLLLCAVACALRDSKNTWQQSSRLPQVPTEVECKAHSLFLSVDIPASGREPRFEAIDATGAYPVTESYGAQCGYTYSVQPMLGRVDLRASYFSCHTGNQNDEVFTFMFGVFVMDESGKESFFNVSKTCSVPPLSPRVVTCEENYMEVSVRTDLPTAGSIKEDFSAALAVAQSSAVEAWQVMLQQEGQQSEVMSIEDAATLGYFIMVTPGRLVFRTTFGQRHASVKMVDGGAAEVIQATVFFRRNWMVVMVDLVAACSLDKGSFDGYRLHWRTPPVRTPLVVGPSLRREYIGMGVDGEVVDERAVKDRGYYVTVGEETVGSSISSAAGSGIRKHNVVRQMATPPVPRPPFSVNRESVRGYSVAVGKETVGSSFSSAAGTGIQKGVVTKHDVVRQMATPPVPRPPFSVNQTTLEERVFQVFLGNIPSDVELVSVELNGQEISVSTAAQMGYSITRVSEGKDTFAYIIRVPFDDQFVVKQYTSAGFEYSLEIKWTLNIRPQMEAYYHYSSVSALIVDALPPVFDSMCTDSGISFMKDHQQYDYLWDIAIGSYTLTPQLASERGYILTNDSTTLKLAVPLFTIGYVYEDITLQQFYGTFELLARNAKTLEIEQSSAKRCLFQTTELLVCSTEGVMSVVADITKVVPSADPARTTLLDINCRPQETDETRVLFSFGLNTCGTRFQIDQQYVTYENEIIFHEMYSTDSRPVITRDAAYRMTMRCIYPVRDTESLFVDRKFRAETPGIGQIKDPVKVPPQMLKPMQTVTKPSFWGSVARKPAEHARVGQWSAPLDKYAQ
ncbi:zona pellucida protein AX 4 isoform X9 [Cyprinus carpio]|uniref:Zona pellucida protein AX 4 isoform X9 n=1 Tax=Cyprinus carpio TaxID=7962 RepID=A0A9Q9WGG4_CYPCA|nr:zona pellucida protein AX 4 isoform X9 [Cyprinus carpio]